MQEVRNVVVEVGQRDGQLVEGVVDVVVDGEVVAALVDGIAIGAALRAGDGEGEAVDEGLGVGAVGQRLGEVDLHRVIVIDGIAVALRPGDVDALVGSAGLDAADNLGDMRRGGVEIDVAGRGCLVQPDGDGGGSGRRDVVVAETPLLLTRKIDRGDIGRLAPGPGQIGVINSVAVHVGEFLTLVAITVLVGIDEGLEAGAVAIENAGDRVVVAAVAVGNMEPDILHG